MPIDGRRTSSAGGGSDSEAEHFLDDDEEYEEIEVEEEVEEEFEEEVEVDEEEEEEGEEKIEEEQEPEEEEEEEVEEEEEEDGEDDEEEEEEEEEEFGEDLTPIEEDHQQDSQAMESPGHEEQLKPVSSTPEKSLENLLPDTLAIEGSSGIPKSPKPIEMRQVDESSVNDERKHAIASEDKDKQDSGAVSGTPKDRGDAHYDCKTPPRESGIMSDEATEPSSVSAEEVTGTVSMKDILDKEANNTVSSEEETKQMGAEKDLEQTAASSDVPLIRPRSLSPGADFKDSNKRPAVICDFFAKGWCIKGNSCRFLHIKDCVDDSTSRKQEGAVAAANQKSELQLNEGVRDSTEGSFSQECGKSPMGKSGSQELHLYKDNARTISPFKDDYGKYAPIISGESPISSVRSLDTHRRGNFATNLEEMVGRGNPFSHNDRSLPGFSRSLNSGSSTSVANPGIFSSNHISPWARSSSPFSSSSWNLDPLGTHKRLDSDRENFSSIISTGYKTKISSNDWEPSTPFRSAFLASKNLLSPGSSQYDPIHDSIEPPKFEDGFSKFPSSTYLQRKVNPALPENSYGKDLPVAEKQIASFAEWKSRNTLPKEDKLSASAHIRDITKSDKASIDSESTLQSNGPKAKVDRDPQNNEMDVDLIKMDENMYKESKALKHFRAALIEFVKELVKPAWRDGLLSKDAHKVIVKKAVDKVLSTLPPHQVPCTAEAAKFYLSASQPKIAKLVEGYVEKYGKHDLTG